MNKHPYAEILHAIAEGEGIQIREACNETWEYCQPNLFFANMNANRRQYEYRIAPKTVTIHGFEFEGPVKDGAYGITVAVSGQCGPIHRFNFASAFARNAAFVALIQPLQDAE